MSKYEVEVATEAKNEELRRAVNIIFGKQKKNYKFYEIQMKYKLKYGHISFWDTSRITNMSKLFISIRYFNENINDWDVSNVTDMSSMFQFCYRFNQPLDKWDVSNVSNMFRMFKSCTNFKQSLIVPFMFSEILSIYWGLTAILNLFFEIKLKKF